MVEVKGIGHRRVRDSCCLFALALLLTITPIENASASWDGEPSLDDIVASIFSALRATRKVPHISDCSLPSMDTVLCALVDRL